MPGPLEHLRVLELCDDVPGAYCARQFALWGADVQVIEPAEGSPLRARPPHAPGAAATSLLWEFVGAGKRSWVPAAGRDVAGLLADGIGGAHVLVTDLPTRRLQALGWPLARIRASAPHLVLVHVSPFGLSGPYADHPVTDLTLQAACGYLSMNGARDREPLHAPAHLLPGVVGATAFVGALAQLHKGGGDLVEVAGMEAIASILNFTRTEYTGVANVRGGDGVRIWPVGDGYLVFSPATVERVLEAAGRPQLVPEGVRDDVPRLAAFLADATRGVSATAVFDRLVETTPREGPGLGKYNELPALLHDRHLEAIGFFRRLEHATLGALVFPGPPARLSRTPAVQPLPAPAAGEGGGPWPAVAAAATRSGGGPPLAGLRVVDLTTAWIGPYASMLLGDLGADVIKIENPRRPDGWRFFAQAANPQVRPPKAARAGAHPGNTHVNFNSVNRNKRSLTLDLKQAPARDVLLSLVGRADVVLENFTPRVMDGFGLGYDVLAARRPGLVMTSFSGYSKAGPYANYKASGVTIEAVAGWDALYGYRDRPPLLMGFYQADAITGLQLAATTLVALLHRQRTGEGQSVEGSMIEAAVGYVGDEVLLASAGGRPERLGNRDREMVPHGVFACAGSDRWLAVAVRDDADWQALAALAGDARFRAPQWETAAGRFAEIDAVEALLAEWVRGQDAFAVAARLVAAGIPAAAVANTLEVLDDAHMGARDWFRRIHHPDLGEHRYTGFAWRFHGAELQVRHPPPRLGEHGRTILREEAGLDDAAIGALFAAGVTAEILERPPPAAGATAPAPDSTAGAPPP
jgi:crotonobetainyl-CoA:carnitine CoA-transferase CaiB-like acyl-CoA transferase